MELSLRERAPLNVDESIESILAERSASKPGKGYGYDERREGGLRRVEIETGITESVCIYILSFGPEDVSAQTNVALSSYDRICS